MAERSHERRHMVEQLVVQQQLHHGPIVSAIQHAHRHVFVPEEYSDLAYTNQPVPLDDERAVSAPGTIAKMAEILDLKAGERVLEIGTGSGYHTAVTADIVGAENVYSVECEEKLAVLAEENIATLDEQIRLSTVDFDGVHIRVEDGWTGWEEHAPYDAIYMTCGTEEVPEALFDQLAPDGRLLVPIGTNRQTLVLFEEHESEDRERSEHDSVRFSPLLSPSDEQGSKSNGAEEGTSVSDTEDLSAANQAR